LAECSRFVAWLQEQGHDKIGSLAFEFLILTGSGLNEVLGATLDEINLDTLDGPVWTIPKERMKGHKPHRVP
jgi:integrase